MPDFSAQSSLMLEESVLRVPYEVMRKTFKSAQKQVEKETTYLKAATNDPKNIDEMISHVRGLKRKLEELRAEQETNIKNTTDRVEWLSRLFKIPNAESSQFDDWSKTRLDTLLVDYFLRHGYPKAAEAHAKAKHIESLVDVKVLQECYWIKQSLLRHDTSACIAWCSENKSYLKKVRSSLEFEVRLQYSIELIKAGKKTDAVQYNRKYLSKSADTHMPQIQQASALLAFPPDTGLEPYKSMFSESRWESLAKAFVATYFNLHGLPAQASLIESLAVGLSVLKTHSCVEDGDFTKKPAVDLSKGNMCPVCSSELNELSQELPFALHVRCRLEPDPVVMPNGRIYGRKQLVEFSLSKGVKSSQVCCPATLEIFDLDEIKDVYPS